MKQRNVFLVELPMNNSINESVCVQGYKPDQVKTEFIKSSVQNVPVKRSQRLRKHFVRLDL